MRIAESLIQAKKLFQVPGSPQFRLPAYMVFPRDSDSVVMQQVLDSLRSLAVICNGSRLKTVGLAMNAVLGSN